MKKFISLILSVCIIFCSVAVIGSGADGSQSKGSDVPVIYIEGSGFHLFKDNGDGTTTRVYPVELSSDEITAIVNDNIDVFTKAFFTQDWSEFCDVLYEIITDIYSELALDENGNPQNGVYAPWSWKADEIRDKKNAYGKYDIQSYTFHYDWRLDPYRNADILRSYIEDVMAATNSDGVAILGRCLGANLGAAYMDKYCGEYVSDFIFYSGAHNSAAVCSKLFAGDIHLEADAVERFLYDMNLLGEGELYNDLLNAFITVLNETHGLDVACWAINNVYDDIYLDIMPRVMVETFATYPGYWSMVSTEDYDRAKEVVFHDADPEKYANFIKIIDNYHYNVAAEIDKDFKTYADNGTNVFTVAKYGKQALPVSGDTYCSSVSDNTAHLRDAANGATAMPIGQTFSEAYISSAKTMGTYKYISPDLQIDASTALFPERTWFIKDIKHSHFPNSIDRLFAEMLGNENFTVFSDSDFPQYMVYNKKSDTIEPMTQENMNTESWYGVSFIEALKVIFRSINELILQALAAKTAPEA